MEKLATLFIACLILILNSVTSAQNVCCSPTTTAPAVAPGYFSQSAIDLLGWTPAPTLAVTATSDLPNTEFLITKKGTLSLIDTSTSGTPVWIVDTTGSGNGTPSGDVVIGADADGIFQPGTKSKYGISLAVGDTFELTAVGYDLPLVKGLAEQLLNGSGGGTPCCSLFVLMSLTMVPPQPALAGFCDSVRSQGIYGSSDINGLEDVLTVFDAISSGQTSVASMINVMELMNEEGNNISTACGGTGADNFMPFGIDRSKKYGYDVPVKKLSDVSLFMMYPNPTQDGEFYLFFTTTKEVDMSINVYDTFGRQVHAQTLGNITGDFSAQIPTSHLSTGIYYVEITDGQSNQTQKLIVR